MRQFRNYKIFVVESEASQAMGMSTVYDLRRNKLFQEANAVLAGLIKQTDTGGPSMTRYVKQYEDKICGYLAKIHATAFGQIFFRTLNPNTEIWITPRNKDSWEAGNHSAITIPFDDRTVPYTPHNLGPVQRGSTYILFRPEADFDDTVLVHELIHAYRYSYGKLIKFSIGTDFQDTEEFFATVMQCIYRSATGRLPLNGYEGGEVSVEEAYEPFRQKEILIGTLKHFMQHEYLAMLMSNLAGTPYNPFRDFADEMAKEAHGFLY